MKSTAALLIHPRIYGCSTGALSENARHKTRSSAGRLTCASNAAASGLSSGVGPEQLPELLVPAEERVDVTGTFNPDAASAHAVRLSTPGDAFQRRPHSLASSWGYRLDGGAASGTFLRRGSHDVDDDNVFGENDDTMHILIFVSRKIDREYFCSHHYWTIQSEESSQTYLLSSISCHSTFRDDSPMNPAVVIVKNLSRLANRYSFAGKCRIWPGTIKKRFPTFLKSGNAVALDLNHRSNWRFLNATKTHEVLDVGELVHKLIECSPNFGELSFCPIFERGEITLLDLSRNIHSPNWLQNMATLEVFKALQYVDGEKVTHGDLKPTNTEFLSMQCALKLSDADEAIQSAQQASISYNVGRATPDATLEVDRGEHKAPIDGLSDIHASCIAVSDICTGNKLNPSGGTPENTAACCCCRHHYLDDEDLPGKAAFDFPKDLLQMNSKTRCSHCEALKHLFLRLAEENEQFDSIGNDSNTDKDTEKSKENSDDVVQRLSEKIDELGEQMTERITVLDAQIGQIAKLVGHMTEMITVQQDTSNGEIAELRTDTTKRITTLDATLNEMKDELSTVSRLSRKSLGAIQASSLKLAVMVEESTREGQGVYSFVDTRMPEKKVFAIKTGLPYVLHIRCELDRGFPSDIVEIIEVEARLGGEKHILAAAESRTHSGSDPSEAWVLLDPSEFNSQVFYFPSPMFGFVDKRYVHLTIRVNFRVSREEVQVQHVDQDLYFMLVRPFSYKYYKCLQFFREKWESLPQGWRDAICRTISLGKLVTDHL